LEAQNASLPAARASRVAHSSPDEIHPVVDTIAWQRGRHTDEAWRLVETAAALGPRCTVEDLSDALGMPISRLLPPLRELFDSGLLLPRADSLEFVDEALRREVALDATNDVGASPANIGLVRPAWSEREEVGQRDLRTTAPTPLVRSRPLLSHAIVSGRYADVVAAADHLLARRGLPTSAYAIAEISRIHGLLALDDLDGARSAAEMVLAGVVPDGGDAALSGALHALALLEWHRGRTVDALGLARAAVLRADSPAAARRNSHPRLTLAYMLIVLGELQAAERIREDARREIEEANDRAFAPATAIIHARLGMSSGDLCLAAAEVERALVLVRDLGRSAFRAQALDIRAAIRLSLGDVDAARADLRRAKREPAPGAVAFGTVNLVWLGARLAELEGGQERAGRSLCGVYENPAMHKRLFIDEAAFAAWAVRLALTNGDRRAAEGIVACVEQVRADNPGVGTIVATAAHARGVLDRDPVRLVDAAALHRHPWAQASALEDGGTVLADRGQHQAARRELEHALAIYEAIDAVVDAERARARVAASTRRHRRARRGAPVAGWASLTDTECRVAQVIATGLTNVEAADRMFLSRHTVDFHLRQIFRKLGVRSRVELTRLVLARDGDGATAGRLSR
jgi:DNA-binding CsgD family transcriptional regulator